MRILLSAYACNPYRGSEQSVGWGWSSALAARGHEVWVITAAMHQPDIERMVREGPPSLERMHFVYIPRRRIEWLEKVWPPAYLWTYGWWLKAAFRIAEQLHRQVRFDLVHQCTYVGFRVPGHLWRLNIPFVWGPIGGLENTPWRFLPMLGPQGCAYYACRNAINTLQKLLLVRPRRAMAKAALCGGIIAATEGIRREICAWYGRDSRVICEIGPPPDVAVDYTPRHPGEPLRLAWSGLHLSGKALPLLLRALARLPRELAWELTVLGDGPCTARWQKLARRLRLDARITWTGRLPRSEAVARLHRAHVFVITSMKDLTSTVLLEAFSQGVPVVCPDHCGFSNVVTSACGIKLPVRAPRQLEADLAEAIAKLASDETQRRNLAAGALRRIGDFCWEKKALAVEEVYRRATAFVTRRAPTQVETGT